MSCKILEANNGYENITITTEQRLGKSKQQLGEVHSRWVDVAVGCSGGGAGQHGGDGTRCATFPVL